MLGLAKHRPSTRKIQNRDQILRKLSSRQWAGAVATGLLLFLASPGLFSFAPLAWLALVPLLVTLARPGVTRGSAARLGLTAGMVYFPLLLYWITYVLGQYGNLPFWVTVPLLLLLALYMSLYLAAFSLLTWQLQGRSCLVWLAPVAWVGLDWLRGCLFTGFPWQDLGYSQYQSPLLIQVADLCGHHGVTFLIIMTNALLALAVQRFPEKIFRPARPGLALIAALLLLLLAGGYSVGRYRQIEQEMATAETLKVAVIQGNIDQDDKWLPHLQETTLKKYLDLSRQELTNNNPPLLVWPETAMPFYLSESTELIGIETLTASAHTNILTGAPHRLSKLGRGESKYFNSAFLISDQGILADRYDKEHLVPFGEYVPLKKAFFFLGPLVQAVADFSPGTNLQPIPCHGTQLGVLICFESIFPDLARRQTSAGAGLLVNLTNDAWYGRSSAPWQHLAMAVFRAVENRRSLARAANTGVSGFIDPLGRMHQLSPLFIEYSGCRELPLLRTATIFTSQGGHLVGIICLFLTLLLALILKFRKSSLPC
ncbi:MAG: apolipoprotein N-acyltransferase [Desulfobulbaceae bacterium]|nr:apolipoprotein N-acyltransferase [Desulfobulbaceae bacterium]